jgi:hypothetical protein
MKGQLDVSTPAEYIAAVDENRRSDIAELVWFRKLTDLDESALVPLIGETARMDFVA